MVSQLSARLLMSSTTKMTAYPSDYDSSGMSRSDTSNSPSPCTSSSASAAFRKNETKRGNKRAPLFSSFMPSSVGGSSGYLGDQSAVPSSFSVSSIDLHTRMARKEISTTATIAPSATGSSEPDSNKRRKTNRYMAEMNYIARIAKHDLERSGLLSQRIQVHRTRSIPPRLGVDTSTVSLLFSDASKSPFLAAKSLCEARNKQYLECPFQLMAMVQATSCHYRPSSSIGEPLPAAFTEVVDKLQAMKKRQQHLQESETSPISDSDSTTSSVTVSDTEVDAWANTSDRYAALHAETKRTSAALKSAVVPIGEALNISRHPRIITLAKAPFNVVQANAAFHRLTGSTPTSDFLGKPLRELTVDGTLIAALKEAHASLEPVAVPEHHIFRHAKHQQHMVTVSPVGAPGQDAQITHFAIKLRCSDRSSSNAATSTNRNRVPAETTRNTNSAPPINVMG